MSWFSYCEGGDKNFLWRKELSSENQSFGRVEVLGVSLEGD